MTALRMVGTGLRLRWPRLSWIDARQAALVTFVVPLTALLALSVFLRTRDFNAGFWIDEGVTVGIASHSLLDIPGVLTQDGSPPVYYMLLHLWMSVVGSGEGATHVLSLLFAVLAVPGGLWAGWSLFGRRAGWICAGLASLNPFLTIYAQETRMYSLVGTLGIVASAAFVHAFVFGRRRYVGVFAGLLIVMVYTHNWALFFAAASALALVPCLDIAADRRRMAIDAAAAYGATAVAFAPWMPTLISQARHTGAPWSRVPPPAELLADLSVLPGGEGAAIALLLAAGTGMSAIFSRRGSRERTAVIVILVLAAGTLALAWLTSQVAPAWTTRYLSVIVGPLLLVAAVGLARAGRFGLVGLALVAVLWVDFRAGDSKSNVREVAAVSAPRLAPGDVVISTHPEQVPVIRYYMPPGIRYTTPLGPVPNPSVMDWRDALDRLQARRAHRVLGPLLDNLPPGRRLLLVRPVTTRGAWDAPWTKLVRQRSAEWRRVLAKDNRFASDPVTPIRGIGRDRHAVRAVLYEKVVAG